VVEENWVIDRMRVGEVHLPIDAAKNLEARQRLMAALRTQRTLGVTGAGVSAYAGYGTWWGVLHRLAEEVERHSRGAVPDADVVINANPDPLHCARELGRLLGDARFQRFIQTEFQPRTTTPHDVLYRIANLPFAHFLTFNFDTSNERVHEAIGRPCASITTANDGQLLEFLRNFDGAQYARTSVHIHGLYSDPIDRIVLTNAGYARLYRSNNFFRQALWSLAISRQLVFLGYSFNDAAFNKVMTDVAWDLGEDQEPNHFAVLPIWPAEDDAPVRNTYNDTYLIEPVFYELRGDRNAPDYGAFVELMTGIANELGAGGAPGRLVIPEEVRPAVDEAGPGQDDLRRARELGDAILDRFDPGGEHV
jgi:SIR2-like domain